jgi:hypothetical protein
VDGSVGIISKLTTANIKNYNAGNCMYGIINDFATTHIETFNFRKTNYIIPNSSMDVYPYKKLWGSVNINNSFVSVDDFSPSSYISHDDTKIYEDITKIGSVYNHTHEELGINKQKTIDIDKIENLFTANNNFPLGSVLLLFSEKDETNFNILNSVSAITLKDSSNKPISGTSVYSSREFPLGEIASKFKFYFASNSIINEINNQIAISGLTSSNTDIDTLRTWIKNTYASELYLPKMPIDR